MAVLGSVSLTEDEADNCLHRLRLVTRQHSAGEVHFRGLKSERGREGVLALLGSEVLSSESVRGVIAHKEFMAVCKLVDLTLEPLFDSLGENLYARNGALATANVLFFTAATSAGVDTWRRVLEAFNATCLRPEAASFEAFFSAVDTWRAHDRLLDGLADALQEGARWLPDALLDSRGAPMPDPMDPALPHFVLLARSWGDHFGSNFSILHDHSEIIERWRIMLLNMDRLPNVAEPGSRLERLSIVPETFDASGDSRQHSRLQVVDIVVGAVRTWASSMARGVPLDGWSTALRDLTAPWLVNAVWPDAQFFDDR